MIRAEEEEHGPQPAVAAESTHGVRRGLIEFEATSTTTQMWHGTAENTTAPAKVAAESTHGRWSGIDQTEATNL